MDVDPLPEPPLHHTPAIFVCPQPPPRLPRLTLLVLPHTHTRTPPPLADGLLLCVLAKTVVLYHGILYGVRSSSSWFFKPVQTDWLVVTLPRYPLCQCGFEFVPFPVVVTPRTLRRCWFVCLVWDGLFAFSPFPHSFLPRFEL